MICDRIQRIGAKLRPDEAALITSDAARLYLTGFSSSAGVVLVTQQQAYFLIDFRYIEKARSTVTSCEVLLAEKMLEQLNDLLKGQKIKTVFVETNYLDVASFLRYREGLSGVLVSDDPCLDKLMTGMRAVKSAEETAFIEKAQQMTDQTFSYILNQIKVGKTEREIALEMEFYMRRLGSEGVSFDFIVISGKNTSLPHGVPTDKKIKVGDFVTMDFGAVYSGYRSDMTRTVAVGQVTDEQKKVYQTVLAAQSAALRFIRAGVHGCEVDKTARDVISAAGYGEYFGHALGHSVGIEIHESPTCSTRCTDPLRSGTIMTIEPGIYLPGKFGVRIEDMVSVGDTGCDNLTKSDKNLIII